MWWEFLLSSRQPLYYDALLPEWHHPSYYRVKKTQTVVLSKSHIVSGRCGHAFFMDVQVFWYDSVGYPRMNAWIMDVSLQSVAINEEPRVMGLYCTMTLRWFQWNIKAVWRLRVCRFRVCPRTRALRQCLWCTWWRTRTCSWMEPSPAASSTSWRLSWWDISSSTRLWSSPSVSRTSWNLFWCLNKLKNT